MKAIQFVFTEGVQSPQFEADFKTVSDWKWRTIEVDHTRRIKEVSVNVSRGVNLDGLRLIDELMLSERKKKG